MQKGWDGKKGENRPAHTGEADVTTCHKFILQPKSEPCWHHCGAHMRCLKGLGKMTPKNKLGKVLRQCNDPSDERFEFGADAA